MAAELIYIWLARNAMRKCARHGAFIIWSYNG
jgi:hypothetical protein